MIRHPDASKDICIVWLQHSYGSTFEKFQKFSPHLVSQSKVHKTQTFYLPRYQRTSNSLFINWNRSEFKSDRHKDFILRYGKRLTPRPVKRSKARAQPGRSLGYFRTLVINFLSSSFVVGSLGFKGTCTIFCLMYSCRTPFIFRFFMSHAPGFFPWASIT